MQQSPLNASEISEIIKQRISSINIGTKAHNEGTVMSISDGIIRIHGLADVMYGEMIELPGQSYAMALNLVRAPWNYDVVVTENLMGDIL